MLYSRNYLDAEKGLKHPNNPYRALSFKIDVSAVTCRGCGFYSIKHIQKTEYKCQVCTWLVSRVMEKATGEEFKSKCLTQESGEFAGSSPWNAQRFLFPAAMGNTLMPNSIYVWFLTGSKKNNTMDELKKLTDKKEKEELEKLIAGYRLHLKGLKRKRKTKAPKRKSNDNDEGSKKKKKE